MKMVMYGAGSIGRCFIGPLFARSGYEVTFVDVDPVIVGRLNELGRYRLHIVTDDPYELEVENVRGVDGRDTGAVAREIAGCNILAVSLGPAVLERVAPVIAEGLRLRGGSPLDILICENLKDAAKKLRGWLSAALSGDEQALLDRVGLVETAIGRMVPVMTEEQRKQDPLCVWVEEYEFLPVDRSAFVGPLPEVPQIVPCESFSFYEERKLYMHNMGHAACAYFGSAQGYSYIWQAMRDPQIRLLVQGAMMESAAMLSVRYSRPFPEILAHAEDLLLRFQNRLLGDTCERVARDPMRKLAAGDRFAAPLSQCLNAGVAPAFIAAGMAAALRSVTTDRASAAALLADTSGLEARESAIVLELYDAIASGVSLSGLIRKTEAIKRTLRGKQL